MIPEYMEYVYISQQSQYACICVRQASQNVHLSMFTLQNYKILPALY